MIWFNKWSILSLNKWQSINVKVRCKWLSHLSLLSCWHSWSLWSLSSPSSLTMSQVSQLEKMLAQLAECRAVPVLAHLAVCSVAGTNTWVCGHLLTLSSLLFTSDLETGTRQLCLARDWNGDSTGCADKKLMSTKFNNDSNYSFSWISNIILINFPSVTCFDVSLTTTAFCFIITKHYFLPSLYEIMLTPARHNINTAHSYHSLYNKWMFKPL